MRVKLIFKEGILITFSKDLILKDLLDKKNSKKKQKFSKEQKG